MMNTGGGWGERFMPMGGTPLGGGQSSGGMQQYGGMNSILQRLLGMFSGGGGGVTHGNLGSGVPGSVAPMPTRPVVGGGMMSNPALAQQPMQQPQGIQNILQMLSGLNGRMGFRGPNIPGGGRVM